MIDPLNFARMLQKFASRKKSIGYSHPPIQNRDGSAWFAVHDGAGGKYHVIIREYTLEEEISDFPRSS